MFVKINKIFYWYSNVREQFTVESFQLLLVPCNQFLVNLIKKGDSALKKHNRLTRIFVTNGYFH